MPAFGSMDLGLTLEVLVRVFQEEKRQWQGGKVLLEGGIGDRKWTVHQMQISYRKRFQRCPCYPPTMPSFEETFGSTKDTMTA